MESATNDSKSKALFRSTQVVSYILYVLEVLLIFRFFLRLIGANPAAGFTDFIYTLSRPFAKPFIDVVGATQLGSSSGSVFEWTTLLAMLVYWLVALGIIKLLTMSRDVSHTEAKQRLEEEDQN